jgi:hypothetical protein
VSWFEGGELNARPLDEGRSHIMRLRTRRGKDAQMRSQTPGTRAPGQAVERRRILTWVVLAPAPYDRAVATASPSPTPNPDATKFTLDTTLPATFNVTSADAAIGNRFAEDVFAAGGVAAVFGVNDFVTVTRQPGADWGPIVAAVQAAAAAHL